MTGLVATLLKQNLSTSAIMGMENSLVGVSGFDQEPGLIVATVIPTSESPSAEGNEGEGEGESGNGTGGGDGGATGPTGGSSGGSSIVSADPYTQNIPGKLSEKLEPEISESGSGPDILDSFGSNQSSDDESGAEGGSGSRARIGNQFLEEDNNPPEVLPLASSGFDFPFLFTDSDGYVFSGVPYYYDSESDFGEPELLGYEAILLVSDLFSDLDGDTIVVSLIKATAGPSGQEEVFGPTEETTEEVSVSDDPDDGTVSLIKATVALAGPSGQEVEFGFTDMETTDPKDDMFGVFVPVEFSQLDNPTFTLGASDGIAAIEQTFIIQTTS